MAQFANITITKAGLNMIAQSQAGETLIFTKAKLGDGQVGDTNIQELTDIISAKLTAELTSVTAAEEGHVVIKFVVDNSSLETGFFVRELGIYAKVGEGGTEQLYGYTNAGNYTNWLSDKSIPIDAITTQIDLVVGNADEVAFISDKTLVYVTAQDLEDHNASDAAHENRFSLFQKIATLGDEIVKKLALTTTITVITALQTNSWFGQLLKMVLNASGVKYSMAQNGYICLGSFFGGLIIQWGYAVITNASETSFTLPLTLTNYFGAWVTRNANAADVIASVRAIRSNEIILITNQTSTQTSWYYLVICR